MLKRLLAATLALTACLVATPAGTATVLAEPELEVATTSTFTIDPEAGVVRVAVEVAVTNNVPDRTEGDIIYTRYYTGYRLPATAASANASAVDDAGRALTVDPVPATDAAGYVLYDVEFAEQLFFQQTARFTLTYDIVGLPPRSDDPTRANRAYFGFDAFGAGDSGKVNVRVVVPEGFAVDLLGDPADEQQVDGATVYSADAIADPDSFGIVVSARNDDALDQTEFEAAGSTFVVQSWPGDSEWRAFVTTQIETGVPQLAELLGRPWPIDDSVDVIEAYTPYLYGYAGWFSAADRLIEVGEDLDQEVVLHELSHAWFNDNWFADRWLNEGMAQVYSNKVVKALGGTPYEPDPIDTADPGFVVLNDWSDPTFDGGDDEAREDYGYNAAFDVVSRITEEVGEEAMRDVFDAVADDTIAYRGDLPAEGSSDTTDWRRFLDLVEELGGSTETRDLFEQYVVGVSGPALLDARDEARAQYADLLAAGGEWAGPVVVRQHLSTWRFDEAETTIGEAADVLVARDTMVDKAAALGIGYPDHFEGDYEEVDESFDDVDAALGEQIETFDAVSTAVEADARDDGFFDSIGLWGTDVPALVAEAKSAAATGDHDAARTAARDAVDTVDEAGDVGTKRFALAVGALVGFVVLVTLLVVLLRRRRARRRAAGAPAEPAHDELAHDEPAPAQHDESEHTALLAAFPPATSPASAFPPPTGPGSNDPPPAG
jgi:hypothetical protein